MQPILVTLVLCTLGLVRAKVNKEEMVTFMSQCKEQHNATEDVAAILKTYNFPTSQNGKCMLHCVLEKYNMMTGDEIKGKEFADWFAEVYADSNERKEVAARAVGTCITKIPEMKDVDKCEKARRMVQCIFDNGVRVADNNY